MSRKTEINKTAKALSYAPQTLWLDLRGGRKKKIGKRAKEEGKTGGRKGGKEKKNGEKRAGQVRRAPPQ